MVLRSRVATTLCVHVACSPLWLQKVATSDAAAYAKSINALFLETSAKTDSNVQDLFLQISALSGGFSSAATHARVGRVGHMCGCVHLESAQGIQARHRLDSHALLLACAGKRLPPPGASAAFEDDDPPVDMRRKPSGGGGCC